MNEELLCSVIAQPILHSSFFISMLSEQISMQSVF